jgi:hypothetical protein
MGSSAGNRSQNVVLYWMGMNFKWFKIMKIKDGKGEQPVPVPQPMPIRRMVELITKPAVVEKPTIPRQRPLHTEAKPEPKPA